VDASLRRRLTYAKWLYDRGATLAGRGDQFSGMVAMHHFHNAVEIVLRAVILEKRLKPETQLRNANYEAMTNWVFKYADHKGITLSHRDRVAALAARRNAVQHRGDLIAPEVLDDSRIDCYRFLREAFRGYFDVEFDDFRVYDVIENGYVRKLLNTAEDELRQGNYVQSIATSKLVVELAETALEELRAVPRGERISYSYNREDLGLGRVLEKLGNQLLEAIKEVDRTSLLALLGIDARATMEFLSIGVHVDDYTHVNDDERQYRFAKCKSASFGEADARVALNYAFDVALRVEAAGLGPRMSRKFPPWEPGRREKWETIPWELPPEDDNGQG